MVAAFSREPNCDNDDGDHDDCNDGDHGDDDQCMETIQAKDYFSPFEGMVPTLNMTIPVLRRLPQRVRLRTRAGCSGRTRLSGTIP